MRSDTKPKTLQVVRLEQKCHTTWFDIDGKLVGQFSFNYCTSPWHVCFIHHISTKK